MKISLNTKSFLNGCYKIGTFRRTMRRKWTNLTHAHLAIFIQNIHVQSYTPTYNSRLTLFPGQELVSYCLLITSSCFLARKEINYDNLLKKHSLVEPIKEPFKVQKKEQRVTRPSISEPKRGFPNNYALFLCNTSDISHPNSDAFGTRMLSEDVLNGYNEVITTLRLFNKMFHVYQECLVQTHTRVLQPRSSSLAYNC